MHAIQFALRSIPVLVLLLFSSGTASAQDYTIPVLESLHGYAPIAFSGDGFSTALNGTVHDLGVSNPAAIATLDKPIAGIAFQVGSAGTWVFDWSVGPLNEFLPQSAAFVYPLRSWRFGFTMNRVASLKVDLPPIPVRTVEDPSGTGDEIEVSVQSRILALGPVITFGQQRGDHEWSVGARGAWLRSSLTAHEGLAEESGAANGFSWAVGAQYRTGFGGGRAVEVGLVYEGATSSTGPFQPRCLRFVDIQGGPVQQNCLDREIRAELPARVQLGVLVRPLPLLALHVGGSRVFWSGLSSRRSDALEVTAGATVDLNRHLSVSLSAYDTGRDKGGDLTGPYGGRMIYLALGTIVRLGHARLDLAFADGRFFSEEGFQNVLLRVGLSREF